MKNDKLFGALGLARRAGALALGFDAVCEAAQTGKAALVLLAADASDGTKKRVRRACGGRCEVLEVAKTTQQLAQILQKPVATLAVTNTDLAALCKKAGAEEEPV